MGNPPGGLTDLTEARIVRQALMLPSPTPAERTRRRRAYRDWLAEHNYAEVWERETVTGPYVLVALVRHNGADFT